MCDRTQEFQTIASQLLRTGAGASSSPAAGSAVSTVTVVKKRHDVPKSRTAFNDAASEIAKGVHKTSQLLSKLAKLVKSQGLFDDPTEEINSLTYRIKQDLEELNSKCTSAQQYVDGKKRSVGDKNQSAKHNVTVVSSLKSELMNTTKDFKTVLELRSSKMKDQQQRKVELAGNGMLSPMRQFTANSKVNNKSGPSSSSSAASSSSGGGGGSNAVTAQSLMISSPYAVRHDANIHGEHDSSSASSSSSSLPMFGYAAAEEQQLLLAPPATMQYFEAREKAVTEVEKTIGELGQLFKRLATMIAEQQELVERIDEDVENSLTNAEKAHSLLLRTYEQVSSNRGLYLKIGAVLAIFLLFFILFLM